MVRKLFYSPLTGLSFVDLIIDGQHQLGLISSSTSSSPDCQRDFAWLSFADLVAGGQHKLGFLRQQPPRRPTASISWTSSRRPRRRRPTSAGLTSSSSSSWTDGQRGFAGLFFVVIAIDPSLSSRSMFARRLLRGTQKYGTLSCDALSLLSSTA